MPNFGVAIAVIQSGQILLTQREDFEIWCLPGGDIEAGESVAEAALRETREETGLDVELTRLVGIYSLPHWRNGGTHVILFSANPGGGALRPPVNEVLELRYFDREALPRPLLVWHHPLILDALNGVGGSVVWSLDAVWPFEDKLTREELYDRRDRSGLSRQEFYLEHSGGFTMDKSKLQVRESEQYWESLKRQRAGGST